MSEDEDIETCEACAGDSDTHHADDEVCGWVNDECPDGCNTEHEVDIHYVMECPGTGQRWRYCTYCGWETVGRWTDDPTSINGDIICNPYEHDYFRCADCGEWIHSDYCHYSERNEADYCEACYPGDSGGQPGQDYRYCATCNSQDRNMDLLREDFICDHRAIALHLDGLPVQFHDPSIPVEFLRRLAA